jgi:hypothetical protein
MALEASCWHREPAGTRRSPNSQPKPEARPARGVAGRCRAAGRAARSRLPRRARVSAARRSAGSSTRGTARWVRSDRAAATRAASYGDDRGPAPFEGRAQPAPLVSLLAPHLTSGDRRVACDRRVEADQVDFGRPAHSPVPGTMPRCPDVCVGIRNRTVTEGTRRPRRKAKAAEATAAVSRRRDVSPRGLLALCRNPKTQIRSGAVALAQGCERGVRVRLVSCHAPVTGRLAVSRGRLGARGDAARCETLTGESPCVFRRAL